MGLGASIIATLGLNRSGFTKGLQDGVKDADAANRAMSANDAKHTGVRLAGVNKIKHQVSGLAETIIAGGSATDVMTQAVIRLGNSFKFGLGGGIAVAVFAVVAKQIADVIQQAKELRAAINDATQPQGSPKFSSIERIQATLKGTTDAADKLNESMGKFSTDIVEFVEGIATGKDIDSDKMAEFVRLSKQAQEAVDGLAMKEQDAADIEATRITLGEKSAALLKIQQEMQEKIGAAIHTQNELRKHNISVDTGLSVAAAKRAANIKREALNDAEEKTNSAEYDKLKVLELQADGQTQIAAMLSTQLDYERRIKEAKDQGNTSLEYALKKEQAITLEKQAQDVVDANRARHQPTVAEVAKIGGGKAREDARRILRQDELAKRAFARGDTLHGDQHASLSDRLRGGLGTRGVIQKPQDISAEIDKSNILKEINTKLGKKSTI